MSLRVVLADDHVVLRQGVRALLERHGFEVVAEASDGRTAVELTRQHEPNVAVLDIMMPLLNGIDAACQIVEACPGTQVVMLTALEQERLVTDAVQAGVRGFVLKTQAGEDLAQAIQQVSRGGFYVGAGVSQAVVDACRAAAAEDRSRLTSRERQVAQLVAEGKSTKQQRLAALEAGAWDYLSLVINSEELALKLDAFVRVKLETDRALEEAAVEPASGLYTMRGLERRARELVSDAFRRHAPLACLALPVGLGPQGARPAPAAAPPVAVAYAGQILQARGRTSDAIGRLGRNEFGVLAPSTAPDGAVRMARRLTQALETASPRPAGLPPLLVRAGYEAVADLHATPLAPDRLLEHAGAALIQARTAGNSERIRAYQE